MELWSDTPSGLGTETALPIFPNIDSSTLWTYDQYQ